MFKTTLVCGALLTPFTVMSANNPEHASIANTYIESFNELAIAPDDIYPVIESLAKHDNIKVELLGNSYEQRPIYAITLGNGPTKVLMWSQMHGDENTATKALFDFLSFTLDNNQAQWRQTWQDKVTVKIIPMLNPDGAAKQTRRNAQGIDINRDAKALNTPEGKILMQVAKDFEADFAFNLHDQNAYYGVGQTAKPATISVLAPAYNHARDINTSRGDAMRLIAHLSTSINQQIPGHLAKYDDSYSYRSFGDTFSEMGMRTILIESGAHFNDPKRDVARRLNRIMYKEVIDSIVAKSWQTAEIAVYDAIPFNSKDAFVDVLIKNVTVRGPYGNYQTDLAIKDEGIFARVNELGDVASVRTGFQELDAQGLFYQPPLPLDSQASTELTQQQFTEALKQGQGCTESLTPRVKSANKYPVLPCPKQAFPYRHQSAAFLLSDDKGQVQYGIFGTDVVRVSTN